MDVNSSDLQKLHQQVTAIVQVNDLFLIFITIEILFVNNIFGSIWKLGIKSTIFFICFYSLTFSFGKWLNISIINDQGGKHILHQSSCKSNIAIDTHLTGTYSVHEKCHKIHSGGEWHKTWTWSFFPTIHPTWHENKSQFMQFSMWN